ncbi:MAG: PEP-CTERM sorting domain-containing protein [Okeania sp. SIO3I5]|uniref:PEP-CTERM sorting domain-containing protein n=1 Tax=Okeania sp. SIO3I5 TaxID=2607805 RepID=UPI0013BD4E39|nr:PEP-CTERM sorting domain-containing protein [Okeania sp. SIO3I5]NEQ36605.1 PEP-CTERM sorting domain-containing protein [Okeania sp. SIO3I5]
MKLFQSLISVVVASVTAIALPNVTLATTLKFDLEFATSNQNIWGEENGNFSWGGDNGLFAVEWDESIAKNYPFNVGFNAFTEGKLGLQNTFNLNGGIVDALIPVDLFFEIPDTSVEAGEILTIQSGFSFADDASFSTKGINAAYNLDLIFDVATGVDVNPGNQLDLEFDIDETINLVNLDGDNSNLELDEKFGGFDISLPQVNTTGFQSVNSLNNQLISSGEDEFMKAAIDLDGLASLLFGLPSLQEKQELNLGFFGNLGFSYNLLDIEAAIALSMLQNFSLTSDLPAILKLEDNTMIDFNIGDEISFIVPDNVEDFLEIEAFIDFNALFSNSTSLGINFGLDFMAGEFGLELPIIGNQNLGPLFEESIDIYETAFELFNNTFELGGFNQEKVDFQIATVAESGNSQPEISSRSPRLYQPVKNSYLSNNIRVENIEVSQKVRVPEPSSTIGLFTLGILGSGLIFKQKKFIPFHGIQNSKFRI